MPGSGTPLLWDETSPADSANAGAGAGVIRSLETSVRNGLAVEHNWPAATGPNFGYHLLGSARAYVGTQSQVSSSGTDGRLMLTSDTSRLFGVGSGGTVYLGGYGSLSVDSFPGVAAPQRAYWAIEMGTALSDVNGRYNVTFPNSGFSGVPFVMGTPGLLTVNSGASAVFVLDTTKVTPSTFSGLAVLTAGTVSGVTLTWMSIGTRAL